MTIKELRTARGMTQKELAAKAGITQQALVKYETGINKIENMSLKMANAICKALGCKIEELISE